MKIIAYTARRYVKATIKSLRGKGKVLTCPPLDDSSVAEAWRKGCDLAIFNLHGFPDSPAWLGGDGKDDGVPAIKAGTLSRLPLEGVGVFAINCHLGDKRSPMRKALEAAGVPWVISGEGVNYGGIDTPSQADVLMSWFVYYFDGGMTATEALREAKVSSLLKLPKRTRAERRLTIDTLEFRKINL
jgi:hypothetical protein